MTLQEIIDGVGSNINQISESTGSFVEDFVTLNEVKRWAQEAFEDVYKWYAIANKSRFSDTATVGTVADEGIYALGGDATDAFAVSEVYVKRLPTDTDYQRAYPLSTSEFFKYGNETVPELSPRYSEIMIKNTATGKYVMAIEFYENSVPKYTIQDGLQIRYIARPPRLEVEDDVPQRIPLELHKLIVKGATVPALLKMGESEGAAIMKRDFEKDINNFFTQEQSLSTKGAKRLAISRRDVRRFYFRR